jgi:hypothetical protein
MGRRPLLLILDEKGNGHAIMDGRSYRVRGYTHNETATPDHTGIYRTSLDVRLSLDESLDEEKQLQRIQNLEKQLIREREKLDEIRVALNEDDE